MSMDPVELELALAQVPHLVERIAADVEAIGVIGEGINALVGYLAMVSRLLDKPLAILIQSTSAAAGVAAVRGASTAPASTATAVTRRRIRASMREN